MHLSQPFAKDVFNGAAMAIDYIVYEMETPKDKQKKMEAVCVCGIKCRPTYIIILIDHCHVCLCHQLLSLRAFFIQQISRAKA